MKFVNPIEHAIYAAAFVARLHREATKERPSTFSADEWADRAADLAIAAGERAVTLHREAMRRRRS